MAKLVTLKNLNNILLPDDLISCSTSNYIFIPDNGGKKIKDRIFKDELIGNIFSSVSGYVVGFEEKLINKKLIKCYVIINDFKEERKKEVAINSSYINLNKNDFFDLLKSKNLTRIVSLIKLPTDSEILIINAIDEVPYVYNELYRMKTYTRELLDTINNICKIINCKKCIIVIKGCYEKSIRNILKLIGMYPNIKIVLSPDKYLLSNREYLCNYLHLKSSDVNIMSSNDVHDIYEEIYRNKKVTNKIITIYDKTTDEINVVEVKLFSSLNELLITNKIDYNEKRVFINGTMVGYEEKRLEQIIIDENIKSIEILALEEEKEIKCINCSACNKICPVKINVKRHYDKMQTSKKCINCGLCNYICPANINLKKVLLGENYE